MTEALFWLSISVVFAVYVFYPIAITVTAGFVRRRMHCKDTVEPLVSLVISAHNEADVIRAKLENSLALVYPRERLQIAVISDASTDETDAIVGEFAAQGVRLFRSSLRCGKTAALTAFASELQGEVFLLTDANAMFRSDVVGLLLRPFADEKIGFTVGRQAYYKDGAAETSQPERIYSGYEDWLKRMENRVAGIVGGDGAIMAVRRECFAPVEPETAGTLHCRYESWFKVIVATMSRRPSATSRRRHRLAKNFVAKFASSIVVCEEFFGRLPRSIRLESADL